MACKEWRYFFRPRVSAFFHPHFPFILELDSVGAKSEVKARALLKKASPARPDFEVQTSWALDFRARLSLICISLLSHDFLSFALSRDTVIQIRTGNDISTREVAFSWSKPRVLVARRDLLAKAEKSLWKKYSLLG